MQHSKPTIASLAATRAVDGVERQSVGVEVVAQCRPLEAGLLKCLRHAVLECRESPVLLAEGLEQREHHDLDRDKVDRCPGLLQHADGAITHGCCQHALARVGGIGSEKLVGLPVFLQKLHCGGDSHATPLHFRERDSCESRARVHNVDSGVQGLLAAQVQHVDGERVTPRHADHPVVLGEHAGEVCKMCKDNHQKSVELEIKETGVRHCVATLDGACLVGGEHLGRDVVEEHVNNVEVAET